MSKWTEHSRRQVETSSPEATITTSENSLRVTTERGEAEYLCYDFFFPTEVHWRLHGLGLTQRQIFPHERRWDGNPYHLDLLPSVSHFLEVASQL